MGQSSSNTRSKSPAAAHQRAERQMIDQALQNLPPAVQRRVHGALDRSQGWQGRREAATQPRAPEGQLTAFDYAILRCSDSGLKPEAVDALGSWKQAIVARVQAAQARKRQQWNAPQP